MRVRISGLPLAIVLLGAAFAGCSSAPSRRVAAKPEPPLLVEGDAPATVVQAPPASNVAFADRHPLFSRPKQYYDSTNSGKLGKTAAATFIGVPAGFFGEIRQIVTGQPPIRTN